jgi:hypothetical protein
MYLTRTSFPWLGCCLALTLLVTGCGDRAHLWESPLTISGPYKVEDQVMWVDGTRGLVFALDPSLGQVVSSTIPRNATFAAPSPDRSRLLVLTGGKEAIYKGQEAEEPTLTIVAPQSAAAPSVVRSYTLPAAFDRLAVSEDGKRAVAFYSSKKSAADVFRNPNEVALFDLERGPTSQNPTLRTIRSFGSAPHGVAFSPEVAIPPKGGTKHSLAVIMADNYLTFVDMKNLDRIEITVPLAKPDANVTVKPEEVLFSATTATVFVRATGSSDVYALSLNAKTPNGKGENDYLPTINQPSAGKTVRDMVLFADGGNDLILTANASQDLALIDAATSQFSLIPVGEPVDTIVPVPATKPSLALIYSRAQPTSRIHFLELKDLAKNLEKNLTSRSLAKPVHQLVPMPDGQQALVVHNHARDIVSILDVQGEHHTVAPIQGQVALNSFDFAGKSHLVGVSPGLARLGILDLGNLLATSLRLDHKPSKVLAVGSNIVVDHGERQGLVTVVPGPTADRDACRVVWGFLFQGLLDRELED